MLPSVCRRAALFLCTLSMIAASAIILSADQAAAAGFEVGENTPRALARGGTGVVNTGDSSALYFNPALLSRVDGAQVLLSSNILNLDVEFQRDDFYVEPGGEPDRVFERATNQTGLFPAPFLTASFNITDDFTVGAGLFGPPAYGNPCYGPIEDGECQLDPTGATRGMVIEADMIVAYGSLGAGYGITLGDDRRLDVGLTAALAYQQTQFAVVADAQYPIQSPWEEDPHHEAYFRGEDLSGMAPTGIVGLAYQDGPLRLALSYRPPIRWRTTGEANVEFSQFLQDMNSELTDDTMYLETWQAGSLRFGWGLQWGEHPADSQRPRWDLEINTIWENWSVVDNFQLEFDGDIYVDNINTELPLHPVYQRKGYQDTISIRTGLSYGVNSRLTAHGGAFFETAAQPVAYTSADFVSWERYSASLGTSIYLPANITLDLGYAFIYSPDRTVRNGQVYNPIPMSNCRGPDYNDSSCTQPGQPPGNPQNEGTWRANFQIFSAGLSWNY